MQMTEIKREVLGNVDFDEITLGVGSEAKELLGYGVLAKKQEEITDAQPILQGLANLGIEVLNEGDVKLYKYDHQREVAQKSFAAWLVMPVTEWNASNYNAPTWRDMDISEYKEPVPEFVLHKAIQVKKEMPDCRIMIEHLDESPDPFLVIQTTMPNKYSTPTERYFIEVWNEPKFEGRLR